MWANTTGRGGFGNQCGAQKQMSNIRAAGSDDLIKLNAPRQLSLEQYLAYLADDECLEVTPAALRLRKLVLNRQERERQKKKKIKTGLFLCAQN